MKINEDLDLDVEKNRDISKIKKMPKKHIYQVKSFQKWKKSRTFLVSLALRAYTNYVNRFNDSNLFASTEIWRFFSIIPVTKLWHHTYMFASIAHHTPVPEWPQLLLIKVGVGKGYDGHVVKGISKTTIFEKMMLFHRD